jgi:hypothetical protein
VTPTVFAFMFCIQLIQYFLITVNYRAVAQGRYGATFMSDLAIAANGYMLIHFVANSTGLLAFSGYALGGAFGSVLAIWVTKKWFKS